MWQRVLTTLSIPLVAGLTFAVEPAQAQAAPTDEAALAAFVKLAPDIQREAVMWFRAECERLPTFQRGLIDHVLLHLGRDPLGWPKAPEVEVYDATRHAPAQPIVRRFVDVERAEHAAVVKRMLRKIPARELVPAFEYDWALGTVVEVGVFDDPMRIARNALRGIEPRLDLIEALVTQQLDRGTHRAEAKAFAHVYSDRAGNAYRPITLYDAWASGTEMEMPDVESLGIVHDLADDWKRWVAPVAESKQKPLYDWIGQRFVPYHQGRGLRTALARSFLLADPVQRDAYGPSEGRLQAFWERVQSDPAALAEALPDSKKWAEWLEKEGAKVERDLDLWQRGEARRVALRESQEYVRRTFLGILKELGSE